MNQFAILKLFALFCISFAPAQAQNAFHCKLNEGILCNDQTRARETYSGEKANLYRVTDVQSELKYFKVGDGLGKYSTKFPIIDTNVTVTEDMVLVDYHDWLIKLTLPSDKKTFDFFQSLHPFDVSEYSPHRFYAQKVVQNGKVCENASVIKAKKLNGYKLWLLVAVDVENNKPRLIFPQAHLDLASCKLSNKQVSLTIKSVEKLEVKAEFSSSKNAKEFLEFLKQPPAN